MSLIGLLILLIVVGVLFWAFQRLSAAFGLPEPIKTVILVLLVLIVLAFVLNQFGLWGSPGSLRIT